MFVGAGEAAIGIADLCCKAMEADGIPQEVCDFRMSSYGWSG